jgi:hypothetical protein
VTSAPPTPANPNPLGAFASFVAVLAIFLFFTGWIYRWAYFGFFEIELNSLNFPAQSFPLVPIQVILGDVGRLGWSVLATLAVIGLIKATLWLLQPSLSETSNSAQSRFTQFLEGLHRFPFFQGVRWLTDLFPQPLRQDLVIVAWILIALFYLAQWQGYEDAKRDAVNQRTTRPIITLVSPSDKFAMAATLDNELAGNEKKIPEYPLLKNLRIFGDVQQFRDLYNNGTNSTDSSWRLLIESGSWLYIFKTLPKPSDLHPLVLAVNTGDGRVQSIILSRPEVNP